MIHVLYNPLSDNKQGYQNARKIEEKIKEEIVYDDLFEIEDMAEYLTSLPKEDSVILTGGDGTLNRFVNDIGDYVPTNEIKYFPTGTGNDFMKDVESEAEDGIIVLNPYIRELPSVIVKDRVQKFINGIGYGIDGYCCEVGDRLKSKSDKPINYAGIAIKGLLFHFKPADAVVTVDGEKYTYKKVWLAPTMNGKYYGGGMKVAPDQQRNNEDGTVSVVIMHGSGKLKTLMVFPSIFKGEHVKHKEMVAVHTGKEITVEFSHPTALQIDGETVLDVSSYTVHSGKTAKSVEEKVKNEGIKI